MCNCVLKKTKVTCNNFMPFLSIFELHERLGYESARPCIGVHLNSRVRSRFFDQVERETMYASSGNKHFFTK